MKHQFNDIHDAFEFINSAPQFENGAILSLDSGTIYWISDMGDSDEMPDDVEESDRYVHLPHKNDLDLGRRLVEEFALEHLPDDYNAVRGLFRSRGAYARFKDLLHSKGLLEIWYEYENTRTEAGLREWCEAKGIELAD